MTKYRRYPNSDRTHKQFLRLLTVITLTAPKVYGITAMELQRQLAEHGFDVHVRTAARDLDFLSICGLATREWIRDPSHTIDGGRGGGHWSYKLNMAESAVMQQLALVAGVAEKV